MSRSSALKIGVISLGCSKNQIDTEMMLSHLDDAGFKIVADINDADIVLINTCGFIGDAKKESLANINAMAKLKKSGRLKKIIVTGCLAERYREELIKKQPLIDAVIGLGSLHAIAEITQNLSKTTTSVFSFEDKEKTSLNGVRLLTNETSSAFLRTSEGCDNRCTYCAIPMIRGKFRSRSMENIIAEAQDLENAGIKELNLIAQDTSNYGVDLYGKLMLPELLKRLSNETNIPWIRLFYCYPDKITDELIAQIRDNPRVLHYIDIPVQHISDGVLKRMNRHGNRALIENVIKKLRQEIPDIVIRTTAIVGFPGETEEEFNELFDFVKNVRFNRFGAFTYSREENTPAYRLKNQIPEKTKQNRYDRIMQLQAQISHDTLQTCLKTIRRVLCEGFDEESGLFFGRDYANGPDVDGLIYFSSEKEDIIDCFVDVEITDADIYDLYGKTV